jgi:hypothetical protein
VKGIAKRKPSLDLKTFSRRRFVIGGAAAAMLASTDTVARRGGNSLALR